MREILFRGKSKETGKWIEGNLIHRTRFYGSSTDDYHIIYGGEFHCDFYDSEEVIPKTVGQYTGLTDKNGTKIFEGDIVKHYNNSDDGFDIGTIYWDERFNQWRRTSVGNFHHKSFTYVINYTCEYEVIGNIHDNPELLKGGAE